MHEVWLKLAQASVDWADRQHFFRVAATAMRRILVDQARARTTAKRGGKAIPIDGFELVSPIPGTDVEAVNESLDKLAAIKPEHARLVELRFFAGQTGEQAAEVLGVSPATADRMWRYARAWLHVEVTRGDIG